MSLTASHCVLWLFVCVILSYGQNDNLVNLCNNDGLYSCICDESTDSKSAFKMQVMCSFQNIREITNEMAIPNNTEIFDLSVNNITSLTYTKLFDNLNILILRLNRNKIDKIQAGTFADLPNLFELDLSENNLEVLEPRVFDGIYKLKKLYLYSNKLTTLQQYVFRGLPDLESLNLSENDIGNFLTNKSNIFALEGLSLNANIERLYLNNVNISEIPDDFFDEAYNLRELYLKRNPIYTFPRVPFTLEVLDVSATKISSLDQTDFLNLPAVKNLYLNDLENLTTIDKYTFIPMRGLNKIELQNCKRLQYLNENAFGVFTNESDFDFPIVDINLMGSGLRTLNENLSPLFSKLSRLDLRSNPWVCDCKIKWLLGLQLDESIKKEIRCDRPPNLQGKTLFSLKPNDLECKTWSKVIDDVTRIVLVILCFLLGGLAVWLVILWPPQGTKARPPMRVVGPDSPYSRITTIQPNRTDDEL